MKTLVRVVAALLGIVLLLAAALFAYLKFVFDPNDFRDKLGEAARKELSEILEQKVHLFLFVKVRENWGNDPERYREMGLEFPKG